MSHRRETRERTNAMVKEVLTLIDAHGVMRRPTWDGVRVLLLILPLTQGDCAFLLEYETISDDFIRRSASARETDHV